MTLKFRFQNLLDSKTDITQGGIKVLEQTVGTTAKIDFSWNLN